MGRRDRETARDTRREILHTALDLFAEHGFHATSMRTLAVAVGVRESAIYHYFPSKTAVLAEVLADFGAARGGESETEIHRLPDRAPGRTTDRPAERPLEELLAAFVETMLSELASPQYRKLVRVMVTSASQLGDAEPLWRRITDERRRALARLLRQLRRAGKVREDVELDVLHLHLVAPLLIATNALFGGGKGPLAMPMQRFVRQHVAFVAQAIAPARAAARR